MTDVLNLTIHQLLSSPHEGHDGAASSFSDAIRRASEGASGTLAETYSAVLASVTASEGQTTIAPGATTQLREIGESPLVYADRSVSHSDETLRGIAFSMIVREAAAQVRRLPTVSLVEALHAASPEAELTTLLANSSLERAMDSTYARAILRGSHRKRELLELAGGALTTQQAADHLGISPQAIHKRRLSGSLLGVRMPSDDWVFPSAQFGKSGAPVSGLTDVIAAFDVVSPWMQLEVLVTEDPSLSWPAIRGDNTTESTRSALAALREDGKRALPAVLYLVRQVGDVG